VSHALNATSLVAESLQEAAELAVVPQGERGSGGLAGQREFFVPSVWQALDEGLAHPVGGEVVVRSGGTIGRIYLYQGAIAWVNCSQLQLRVRDTLLENAGITAEELDASLQESRQLRQHFAETLLAWGLIGRERLWECLRIHNARHLGSIAELRHEPQSLFVPLVRTYSAGLIFKLEELLEWLTAQGLGVTEPRELESEPVALPPPSPASGGALAQEGAEAVEVGARLEALLPKGTLGAVLFDAEARHVHGHFFRLSELEASVEEISLWLMGVVQRQGAHALAREVWMVAEDSIHVVSRSGPGSSLYLWAMFEGSTLLGAALARCHMAVRSLGQEPGART
jgi:hypothetical protein